MIVTPEEASKKYCCFHDIRTQTGENAWCVGELCMAWKEKIEVVTEGCEPGDYKYKKSGKGFCGLVYK